MSGHWLFKGQLLELYMYMYAVCSTIRVLTLFHKQFSRTFPGLFQDSNTFFQGSQIHNNWSNKPLQNRNPTIIPQKIVFKEKVISRVYRFPGLSRTCINFPGLSSPGKCQNKIPGLSRISMTRTNPDHQIIHAYTSQALFNEAEGFYIFIIWYMHLKTYILHNLNGFQWDLKYMPELNKVGSCLSSNRHQCIDHAHRHLLIKPLIGTN